ncbi:hypothetical protein BDV95DRAFT_304837 [Massariosphaeria phaeospora]|uniref:Uncharacterized protein n=1 Tax=Massariosphaeria phaeospora TaxID=100035 RepID=A0A7C8IKC5_9PLEO|nr:hypothetical protein BDV95DRAFT_304837 [Massariosphaeria phaeospora]
MAPLDNATARTTATMKLKRSKTDISDLATPADELTTPDRCAGQPRTKRVFSFRKLTPAGQKKRLAQSSKSSIDKTSISSPIVDPKHPIALPSPTWDLTAVTPPPSLFPSSSSSSGRNTACSARPGLAHGHSASAPTSGISTPYNHLSSLPSRLPPSILAACGFEIAPGAQPGPLEQIPESPFNTAYAELHRKALLKCIGKMEHARLQPPPNVGTKSRAIQQAQEMEMLTAERAKRSGDDPPPYDFFELIGKGAYGRVFKGFVFT